MLDSYGPHGPEPEPRSIASEWMEIGRTLAQNEQLVAKMGLDLRKSKFSKRYTKQFDQLPKFELKESANQHHVLQLESNNCFGANNNRLIVSLLIRNDSPPPPPPPPSVNCLMIIPITTRTENSNNNPPPTNQCINIDDDDEENCHYHSWMEPQSIISINGGAILLSSPRSLVAEELTTTTTTTTVASTRIGTADSILMAAAFAATVAVTTGVSTDHTLIWWNILTATVSTTTTTTIESFAKPKVHDNSAQSSVLDSNTSTTRIDALICLNDSRKASACCWCCARHCLTIIDRLLCLSNCSLVNLWHGDVFHQQTLSIQRPIAVRKVGGGPPLTTTTTVSDHSGDTSSSVHIFVRLRALTQLLLMSQTLKVSLVKIFFFFCISKCVLLIFSVSKLLCWKSFRISLRITR